ncbi:hypothetical protein A2U01_0113807, partial [Trifolium medium]|nr:hypothetical protein [Trifolium medium]
APRKKAKRQPLSSFDVRTATPDTRKGNPNLSSTASTTPAVK